MLARGGKTTRDLLRIVFRRWPVFLLGAAFFTVAAIIAAHFVPLKYTGTAIFRIGLEAAADRISPISGETLETVKERLRSDLTSYRAVEEAIETLGLTKGLPRGEDGRLTAEGDRSRLEMIDGIRKNISVQWESRSQQEDLVSVSFTHGDPTLAESMPAVLITWYINHTYNLIREGLKTTHDFIQQNVDNCHKGLEALRKQRIEFETQHAGMLPDNPSALQDRIQTVSSDLEVLRRQQSVAQQKLQRVQFHGTTQPSSEPSTQPSTQPIEIMGPNPVLAALKDELRKSKDDLEIALNVPPRMTEKHPRVQELRARIEQLEKRIQEEPAQAVLQTLNVPEEASLRVLKMEAEAELAMTNKEIERLENLLQSYQSLWANYGPVRQQYLEFVQKSEDLNKQASMWQQKQMDVEAALQAQMSESGMRLAAVQNPQKQFRPSSPTMAMVMACAILGGLAFGGGMVFLSSVLDRSITATEDAAGHFDIPIVGVIGEIYSKRDLAIRRLKKLIIVPIVTLVVLVALGLSSLSIYLRLEDPQRYKDGWKVNPAKFLMEYSTPARPSRLAP
jgi:uncharacterized protein involved in exopolysaccharide biosynthesis